MYVLVKFKAEPGPVIFTITNSGYAKSLATMDGVEWATKPIGCNGSMVDNEPPQRTTLGEPVIRSYHGPEWAS